MNAASEAENREALITESRPSEVLAALHESAEPEREYLFAAREADPTDLVLVGWLDGRAVGYIATTDQREQGMLIWERLIVPAYRGQGLGRRLLLEACRRAVPDATVEVDPLGELDLDRVVDYYSRLGFTRDGKRGKISATASDVVWKIAGPPSPPEQDASIGELLARKLPGVVTIPPHSLVRDAVERLNVHRIGAVVVSSDGRPIEGIVSERDILVALADDSEGLLDRPVADLITSDVLTCTTDDSVMSAMDSMTRLRIRHLPVTSTGRLVGIISVGDLVSFRLDAVQHAAFLGQAGL